MISWNTLTDEVQIDQIQEESKNEAVLIFKHSTRCSISKTALDRLERNWSIESETPVKAYYLDLLSYRNVSNKIAEHFEVEHQSPQVLIVKEGKVAHVRSHLSIGFDEIKRVLTTN